VKKNQALLKTAAVAAVIVIVAQAYVLPMIPIGAIAKKAS
jgi:hypothetical protein